MNYLDLFDISYKPSQYVKRGRIMNHVVCTIKTKKTGHIFVSLGLNPGQLDLNDTQIKWLNQFGELTAKACDALQEISDKQNAEYEEWKKTHKLWDKREENLELKQAYRKAFKEKDIWLEKFCSDCEIEMINSI